MWCEACAEHTDQVRESELMSGTVEPWWEHGTTEEDRAIITGLNPENFSLKDDCKGFHDACDMWWRSQDERREDPHLEASDPFRRVIYSLKSYDYESNDYRHDRSAADGARDKENRDAHGRLAEAVDRPT